MGRVSLVVPDDSWAEIATQFEGVLDVGELRIPLLDFADHELAMEAVEWFASDQAIVKATINGAARVYGEERDTIYLTFESSTYSNAQGFLDFIFWLHDIQITNMPRDLRFAIGELDKGDALAMAGMERLDMELRLLEIETDGNTTTLDLGKKTIGVQEMTGLTIREKYGEAKNGRVLVEMAVQTEMNGAYPTVALPPDVVVEEGDMFVTLPVGQFNADSLNGHRFLASAMHDMLKQINERRPESNWGHLSDYEMGLRYNPPPVRWLAALEQGGTIFAKARVLTDEARVYYRNAVKDNSRVGTSLWAWAEMDGDEVTHLDLITIDLADPARVGVPMTAAKPVVTQEMRGKEAVDEKQVRELLGLDETGDILAAITDRQTKMQELEARAAAAEARVTELTAENEGLLPDILQFKLQSLIKFDSVRKVVAQMVSAREPKSLDELNAAVTDAVEGEAIKELLKVELEREMGEAQRRPADGNGASGKRYFKIPQGEN